MSYEIHEDRLVTRDGSVESDEERTHFALIESDGGTMRVELADYAPQYARLKIQEAMSDGGAGFEVAELLAALRDLGKLAGLDDPEAIEAAEANERAARVVERACAELEAGGDPARSTLATDLRTTVLGLLQGQSAQAA
jgi:hypothetical protein